MRRARTQLRLISKFRRRNIVTRRVQTNIINRATLPVKRIRFDVFCVNFEVNSWGSHLRHCAETELSLINFFIFTIVHIVPSFNRICRSGAAERFCFRFRPSKKCALRRRHCAHTDFYHRNSLLPCRFSGIPSCNYLVLSKCV